MDAHDFSDVQVEQFRKEGYLVVPSFFGPDVLDRVDTTIRQLTDEALRSEDRSKFLELEPESLEDCPVVRRIYNPYDVHETFHQLANTPQLVDCVQSLIGPNINLQHSKMNMKPPEVGSVVEWHQDLAYFPHTNDDLVTLLIYLDDATQENGCLRVLPRNHTHFFDHHGADGYFAGMITEDLESQRFGQPVALEGPAGSVIFMHCMTPHSSHTNRSSKPRRTLIFEYRAADSFPIQCVGASGAVDADRQIRGKPARFARCTGPPPYIPRLDTGYQSLYELQTHSKKRLADTNTSRVPGEIADCEDEIGEL